MNRRTMGMAISLYACLLTAQPGWAASPSPFALPPEPEQPPAAAAPTTSTPQATQPTEPAPTQPAAPSPFDLPQQPEQSAAPTSQTAAPDPDAAFDLPASGNPAIIPGSTTPPTTGSMPPQAQPDSSTGGVQQELSASELLARGTELARQGRYEEARTALEEALLKEPGNVLCLNNLGLVMRKLGRLEEATRAYTTAIQINPDFALTYKNYGILLEQNGEKRRAVDAYRRYCSLAPNAPDVQQVSQRADWLAGGL